MSEHFQAAPPFTIQGPPPVRLVNLVPTMRKLVYALTALQGNLYQ